MHRKKKRILWGLLLFLCIVLFLGILLYFVRFFNDREIDDVSPGILCEDGLMKKSDVLWIIPLYDNKSIGDDAAWCEYILSLNKTLGMHGVEHTLNEFYIFRDEEYILRGADAFEKCLGYRPTMFKVPQLALVKVNENLLEEMNFEVKGRMNQWTHKVYHCSDTGMFSNRFIDGI